MRAIFLVDENVTAATVPIMGREQERVVFTRDSIAEMLDILRSRDKDIRIDPEEALIRLARVVERKLGNDVAPLPTGSGNVDRLERFFDSVFDVEPPPAEPFSLDELHALFRKTAEELREAGEKGAAQEENEDDRCDALASSNADADDYLALTNTTTVDEAMEGYERLDTYPRGWLFNEGEELRRYYATLETLEE